VSSPTAELQPGDLRIIALSMLESALRALFLSDGRREPPQLLRFRSEEEAAADLRVLVSRISDEQPFGALKRSKTNELIQRVLSAVSIKDVMQCLNEIRRLSTEIVPRQNIVDNSPPAISAYKLTLSDDTLRVEANASLVIDQEITDALNRDQSRQEFVATAMQMCAEYRRLRCPEFGPDDDLALQRAYRLLDEGVRLPATHDPIRHTEERSVQTYLSFADPGDGHLAVTVRDPDLLAGLIVHIEYIDRDNVDKKDVIEAYRLPAIRNAARVRLHVGHATPCTAYIGRPVFEGSDFELGLLKAAHTMASVCSGMFSHGIADCKIAMDGMTASQAAEFMKVVAGNVVRNPLTQSLSAAFNLNTQLKDDLHSHGLLVNKPEDVAELAIRIVLSGHFDKIAWDGASDKVPSDPIIGLLSRARLLDLVHAAHERGLETYISAGLKPHHMRDAVMIGVGGVGIGTKLHYMQGKVIGGIDPDKVRKALAFQKKAAEGVAGQAARELAQLDWRFAERSLNVPVRLELFRILSEYLSDIDAHEEDPYEPQGAVIQLLHQLSEKAREALKRQAAGANQINEERTRRSLRTSGIPWSGPAEQWALRVLASFRDSPEFVSVDKSTATSIGERLLAGDSEGLQRMYRSVR
jgi:hypothetical protein